MPGPCNTRLLTAAAAVAAVLSTLVPLAQPATAAGTCAVAYSGDTLVDPGATTRLVADLSLDDTLAAGTNRTVAFTLSEAAGAVLRYETVADLGGRAATTVAVPEGVYGVVASV
ncbi:MAG: hypothetical protein ABIV94_06310, partial [Acidimicrobiales bacterium]